MTCTPDTVECITTGLTHYWTLDTDFDDDVGSLNLTEIGTGDTPAGVVGDCYRSQSLSYLMNNFTTLTAYGGFTMSMWVYLYSNEYTVITKKEDPEELNDFILWAYHGVGDWGMTIGNDTIMSSYGEALEETWYHVVMRVNSGGCATLSVRAEGDLAYVTDEDTVAPYDSSLGYFWLAGDGSNNSTGFLVDEVATWNRYLSDTEIDLIFTEERILGYVCGITATGGVVCAGTSTPTGSCTISTSGGVVCHGKRTLTP